MSYEQRGVLLKTLCVPCKEKDTCKFGCEAWEKEMDKLEDETEE